jgi:hypothetical protein
MRLTTAFAICPGRRKGPVSAIALFTRKPLSLVWLVRGFLGGAGFLFPRPLIHLLLGSRRSILVSVSFDFNVRCRR